MIQIPQNVQEWLTANQMKAVPDKPKPKNHLVFILSMSSVGSWNGKWTGSDKVYCIVKYLPKKTIKKLLGDSQSSSWMYDFGDGWVARVSAELIDATAAKHYRKITKGFCNYDWMVDSILWYQEILTIQQRKERMQNDL